MWGIQTNLVSSISALLQKENTPIETILDDNALNQAIRTNLPAMDNYLLNPNNMNKLLDIALSNVEPRSKIPNKTTRTAVSILSTGISTLMGKLIKNEEYRQRIINFPKSEFNSNPKCCGHYYRIIESVARYSAGQFLAEIPDLRSYLINNMNCLGLRDLFLFLSNQYSDFEPEPETFVELSRSGNSKENGFYVLSAMRELLKIKEKVIDDMRQVEVVENLFTITKNESLPPMTQIEAFYLIQKIADPHALNQNEDILKLVQKENELYDFEKERPKNVLAAALKVFTTKNPKILLSIFSYESMTFLKDGIIRSFDAFSKEDLEQFINQNDLFNRIIDEYRNSKTNYQLTDLIQIIQTKQVSLTDEFKRFIEEEFYKRNEIRNSPYPQTKSTIKVIPTNRPSEIIKPKLDSSDSDSSSDDGFANHDLDSDDNDSYNNGQHQITLLDASSDDEDDEPPPRIPSPPKISVSIPSPKQSPTQSPKQSPKVNSPNSITNVGRRQSTPNVKKANLLLEEISTTNSFAREQREREQAQSRSVDALPDEEEEYDDEDIDCELIIVNNPETDGTPNIPYSQASADQFLLDEEEIIEDDIPSKNIVDDSILSTQVEKQI